jgi:inorganic pyrophosphatase
MAALHSGINLSSFLVLGFSALICSESGLFEGRPGNGMRYYGCIIIGLLAGLLIGHLTEYFTSYEFYPVKSIAEAGKTGPATVVIEGLGVGMISTGWPIVVIVIAIFATSALAGQYGVAIAAVGMLSTLGVTLATDAYGPIADNAGGIAEMVNLPDHVRETTDALDALGNTTAATGKGFAIGSAVLTSISLLAAFRAEAGIDSIDVADPIVFGGLMFGAMLPFLFAALTMLSVGKAAKSIIAEVRRQFNTIPGLREGKEGVRAEHEECVKICTASSVQEMVMPGCYAVMCPLFIGFLVGPACLAGMLAGAIASGAMLALMMSNAGGAWDNSKKYIEIAGAHGGKGTETHKACVVGDTVGDPFKDTSGPALNILIKLMSVISLTIAPLISGNDSWSVFYLGLVPFFITVIVTYVVFLYDTPVDTGKDYTKAETEMC